MIIIGSARINENKKTTGGLPGDQTGKEVATQPLYNHSKKWVVIRAVNPGMAELIAVAMQRACDNIQIGYDQTNRNNLFEVSQIVDYDPGHVAIPVHCDCSSLVRVCIAYAGLIVPNFTTHTEKTILLKTGAFYTPAITDVWREQHLLERGDILVTFTKGHTAVVLSNETAGTNEIDYPRRKQIAHSFDPKIAGVYRALTDTAAKYVPGENNSANIYKGLIRGCPVRCYGFYEDCKSGVELFCVLPDGKTAFVRQSTLERV